MAICLCNLRKSSQNFNILLQKKTENLSENQKKLSRKTKILKTNFIIVLINLKKGNNIKSFQLIVIKLRETIRIAL